MDEREGKWRVANRSKWGVSEPSGPRCTFLQVHTGREMESGPSRIAGEMGLHSPLTVLGTLLELAFLLEECAETGGCRLHLAL